MEKLSSNAPTPLRIIQFTDTHFFKNEDGRLLGVDTGRSFNEVFRVARESRGTPDLYLFTGDLSQDETEESYRRLSTAVGASGAPCYVLPGNHDRRSELRQGLSDGPADFRFDRFIVFDPWLIVLLDTLVVDEVGGHLPLAELEMLEECLKAYPNHHALVCMHHHPLPVGADWLDTIGIDNGQDLFSTIDKFPSVRGVLWGHIHQEFQSHRNGVCLLATPSTCVQFKPNSSNFAVDALPPGFRWLELGADGLIHTGVCRALDVSTGLELSSAGY